MKTTRSGPRRAAPRLLPGRRESPRSCRRKNIPGLLSDSDPRKEEQRSISLDLPRRVYLISRVEGRKGQRQRSESPTPTLRITHGFWLGERRSSLTRQFFLE